MSINTSRSAHLWTLQTHGDHPGITCTCGELIQNWEHLEPEAFGEDGGEAFADHLTAVGEPAPEGHRLELSHDGDGWVEPFHESLDCSCRLGIGSWTQKDQDHSDYPAWITFLAGPAGVVFAHHLIEVRERDDAIQELRDQARTFGPGSTTTLQSLDQLGPELRNRILSAPTR